MALLLLVSQPSRRLAALCFGAGALLTFSGLGIYWYLTDHQDDLMQSFRQSSVEYDRSGWQRAAIDSFEVQVKHRPDIEKLYLSDPAFPGGPVALHDQMKTLTRPQAKPLPQDAVVEVEFILERDGRITLPHVVYGLGPGYDEEAVRVIQSLPPFSPSLDDEGKAVARVWRVQVPFFH
ncbi:energy transducer TonB [Hymenobacter persicinus]|nr:energy transducer TonB [Hymenobacter persicinus]